MCYSMEAKRNDIWTMKALRNGTFHEIINEEWGESLDLIRVNF